MQLISNHTRIFIVILLTAGLFSSCRSTRNFSVENIKPMSAGKVIRKVSREIPNYKVYESKKVTVNYEDNENKNNFTGQFIIDRNESILLTLKKLSMPLGRGYVTNDSIFLVNYFEKYFIREQIEKVQEIFGIDLDYNLLQALLTADVSLLLQEEEFDKELTSVIDEKMYRIDSQFNARIDRALNTGNDKRLNRFMEKMDDSEFIDYTVWVDPQFFVIRKVTFNDIKYKEELSINYDQYELVGRSLFPQKISFEFNSPKQNMDVELKLFKPSINSKSDINFHIPDKYDEFKLKSN